MQGSDRALESLDRNGEGSYISSGAVRLPEMSDYKVSNNTQADIIFDIFLTIKIGERLSSLPYI